MNDNSVSLFKFNERDIRVVKIDGEPWFVTVDTLTALGYPGKSHGMIIKKLSGSETALNPIETKGRGGSIRQQKVRIVSESGLYKLVMRSDKPEAKAFQNWVTKVVLPAIRKDGGYIQGEENVPSGAMTEINILTGYTLHPRKHLPLLGGG
ncbi:prophage antirepressor-like protein [Mycoplana sp. BE70]|uniref:BRO-N domain-containing protein n=1 Tax=Mycoplana sp. BE70 TaxID=2817775 RepID=UPI0028590B77|nr:BRO family protein [Mycoplana sp. BE70]MDR6755163.1 prophage antirepressor-like protein [Mycoplana sp. BE70]